MDIELAVIKETDEPLVTLKQTKNKDAEIQPELYLEQVTIDVPGWLDEDGEQITTKVMELSESTEEIKAPEEKPLSTNQNFGMMTYIEAASTSGLLDEKGEFQGLALEEWRKVFFSKSTLENDGTKRTAFHRARNDLVKLKWLDVNDNIYIPIGLWAPWEKEFLAKRLQEKQDVTSHEM